MKLLFVLLCMVIGFRQVSSKTRVFLVIGRPGTEIFKTGGIFDEGLPDKRIEQLSCCPNLSKLPLAKHKGCHLVVAENPFHHVCDIIDQDDKKVDYALSFAKKVLSTLPDDDTIVLVPAAIPGTGFLDDVWTPYTGYEFQNAVSKLRTAFQLLEEDDRNPILEGFLWHQGENNLDKGLIADHVNSTKYLEDILIPLVNAFRDPKNFNFTSEDVPFVIGNELPPRNAYSLNRGIWVGVALLDQYVTYTASMPVIHGFVENRQLHHTPNSNKLLGHRYYDAWLQAKDNKPDDTDHSRTFDDCDQHLASIYCHLIPREIQVCRVIGNAFQIHKNIFMNFQEILKAVGF